MSFVCSLLVDFGLVILRNQPTLKQQKISTPEKLIAYISEGLGSCTDYRVRGIPSFLSFCI